jgi:hypothetical protein
MTLGLDIPALFAICSKRVPLKPCAENVSKAAANIAARFLFWTALKGFLDVIVLETDSLAARTA